MTTQPTIHASTVLVGARAIVIRGPAGSGKSRLALQLIQAAGTPLIPFARLVADDRTVLENAHGRVLARPPVALAGLLEVRGLGIKQVQYEPVAVVGLVVDLAHAADRMPTAADREAELAGIKLPRLSIVTGADALSQVIAHIHTREGWDLGQKVTNNA